MIEWLYVYIAVTILAGAGSVVLAILAWRRRHVPGATFLMAMMVGGAIWCGACVGELFAGTLQGKLFWARLGYVGIVSVPWAWLLFCLSYTGRLSRRTAHVAASLAALPALTFVLVLLSPKVPLVWISAKLAATAQPHALVVEHGQWFWVHVTYSYACLLVGSIILLNAVFRQVRPLTAQGVTFVLAAAMPWAANLLTITGLVSLDGLDLTPPAIAATGVLITVGIARLKALDVFPGIVPVARDAVFERMRDGVLVVDKHGRVLNANKAAERLLARSSEALIVSPLGDLLPDLQPAVGWSVLEALVEKGSSETVVPGDGGRERFLEISASSLGSAARASGYVLVMREITERRALEEELRHRALHDELTGLPNRTLLREHLDRLLALQNRRKNELTLLLIDLDRFKEINDTFGHEAGDTLLCVVAERLRKALRESDLVARLGGDEFAVVLPDCQAAHAMEVAATLRGALSAGIDLRNQTVCVAASIGVAISPAHGRDAGTLLRHADVALYLAKETPRGAALYDAALDPNSPARLALLNDLRTAITAGGLELHYQPQIELAGGSVVRVEALSRWRLADGRMIPPDEFIPLAEQNGLIPGLTAWALRTALQQRSTWSKAGWQTDVAVNLSALDLRDLGLVDRIADALRGAAVDPGHLWLEITETSVMSDPERARRVLGELRGIGVHVSIDDFGTGQSSLAYLQTMPADEVKIDRSFIGQLGVRPRDGAIVRAAVTLAHDLGLTVIAEGVETVQALERLGQLGCDHAQGFFIARPMPPESMLPWVQTEQAALQARQERSSAARRPRVLGSA
jgi:diguanylate cyclase (GGDEF)-like protein/PAS domain S-box-containing protein